MDFIPLSSHPHHHISSKEDVSSKKNVQSFWEASKLRQAVRSNQQKEMKETTDQSITENMQERWFHYQLKQIADAKDSSTSKLVDSTELHFELVAMVCVTEIYCEDELDASHRTSRANPDEGIFCLGGSKKNASRLRKQLLPALQKWSEDRARKANLDPEFFAKLVLELWDVHSAQCAGNTARVILPKPSGKPQKPTDDTDLESAIVQVELMFGPLI